MPAESFDEQLARRLTRALADDYLIDEWIAHSERSALGSGREVRGGAPVTIEILLEGTPASERAAFRRDSERAVKLRDRLAHPSIVATLGAGAIGDLPYAATSPIDGRRLDELLESGQRLTADDITRMISGLAHAIAHAHEEGVTHGRIGPRHIVVERKSRNALLADFGAEGGSVSGDIAQLGRAGSFAAKSVDIPGWLNSILEKASRGTAGGYHAAHEIIDDIARHAPSGAVSAASSSAAAKNEVALHAPYVLGRAAMLHQQITGSAASADAALKAFSALNVPATVEALDAAAFEANIERRFVMLAGAENARGVTGESVVAARIVDASVPEVLQGLSRLSSSPLNLVRSDSFGGAPADGGILIFEIPKGHAAWASTSGVLGAGSALLSVTRAANGRDMRASDVVMSAVVDPSRVNGRATSAAIGGAVAGALIGGVIGAMLGGMSAAMVTAVLAAVIFGAVGGFVGRSSRASVFAASKRELSAAIDVLAGSRPAE